MAQALQPIREWSTRDEAVIRSEVIASGRPAVLRGLVSEWPAVNIGRRSATELAQYLQSFDNGTPVDAIMTPPDAEGLVFYDETMSGFNFARNRLPLAAVAQQVLRYGAFPRPPAVAAQSALIRDCVPGFAQENRLSCIDAGIAPRIWLGNAITTPTHLDEWNNIGCVVSGRRRFTLFPPEQIENLYIGPLDFAPTGAPMSLVRLRNPDFDRFPKFRQALAAAQTAELEPGDALFIPPLWWHNVESLQPFNLLVNYWWGAATAVATATDSAFDSLIHAILNLRSLPPGAREAWRALFDHYVFGSQASAVEHIPAHRRGILGEVSAEDTARLRAYLAERLTPGSRGRS
jgi:hypothetical protein